MTWQRLLGMQLGVVFIAVGGYLMMTGRWLTAALFVAGYVIGGAIAQLDPRIPEGAHPMHRRKGAK